MNTTTEKLSFREKFCYGLGDASMNIFMGFTMMFLTIFYTDVFKLNPAVMGTLFLAVRFIDAISDPLCGMISDRTKSVRGRYRPWLPLCNGRLRCNLCNLSSVMLCKY